MTEKEAINKLERLKNFGYEGREYMKCSELIAIDMGISALNRTEQIKEVLLNLEDCNRSISTLKDDYNEGLRDGFSYAIKSLKELV